VAAYVVDLPAKFAGIKVGASVLLRDPEDELEVTLICERHPFQVVLTSELNGT
jgi:hypothetical protein